MLTRRMLLAGVAPGAALVVAGCSTTQQQQFVQSWDQFVSQVTAIVAKGCSIAQGYIPDVTSIEAVVVAAIPGGIGAAVAGGLQVVQTVASALCSAMPANPPLALRRAVRGLTPAAVVGTINIGGKPIQVIGYSR